MSNDYIDKCSNCGCEFYSDWDRENHVCPTMPTETKTDSLDSGDVQSEPVAEEEEKPKKSRRKKRRKSTESAGFAPKKVNVVDVTLEAVLASEEEIQEVKLPLGRKRFTPKWGERFLKEKPVRLRKYFE